VSASTAFPAEGKRVRSRQILGLLESINQPVTSRSLVVPPTACRKARLVDVCLLVLIITIVLVLVYDLRSASLRIPFAYSGDGFFFGANAKTIIETGWVQQTTRLGAPFGQRLYDFPIGGDNGNYLIMKILSFGTKDWALLSNLFFLFTFYSNTVVSYFCLRWLRCGRISSMVCALLYGFAPFHFIRFVQVVLAHYAVVPLGLLLAFRAASGDSFGRNAHRFGWVGWLLVCVAVGSFNSYWAVFGVISLLFVSTLSALINRTVRPLLHGAAFAAVIAVVVVLNQAGTLLFQAQNGPNAIVGQRSPIETDHFGLRLIQLITPIPSGGFSFLHGISKTLGQGYHSEATQYLGLVGSFCFLALLLWLLVTIAGGRPQRSEFSAGSLLAATTVIWILVATTGGLDWLAFLVGFDRIRAWNRSSIVIMFLALAWAALTFPPMCVRWQSRLRWHSRAVAATVGVLVLAVGMFDQASGSYIPNPGFYTVPFESDRDFFGGIEQDLPIGAAVAQFPIRRFPEEPPTEKSADYDLLAPYLQTHHLRWSYGGIKGRESEWQQRLIGRSGHALAKALAATDFDALVIDRFGYADRAAALERTMASALDVAPRVSADGRYSYFSLVRWRSRLRPTDELATLHDRLVSEPNLSPGDCLPFEGTVDAQLTWCPKSGGFNIITPVPKEVTHLTFTLTAPVGAGSVRLDIDGKSTQYRVGRKGVSVKVDVPAEKFVLVKFSADAPAVVGEQRDQRFTLSDIHASR
jgi:phosphoglycerol transferase